MRNAHIRFGVVLVSVILWNVPQLVAADGRGGGGGGGHGGGGGGHGGGGGGGGGGGVVPPDGAGDGAGVDVGGALAPDGTSGTGTFTDGSDNSSGNGGSGDNNPVPSDRKVDAINPNALNPVSGGGLLSCAFIPNTAFDSRALNFGWIILGLFALATVRRKKI